MGKLEEISKKNTRKTRIHETLLLALVSGGRRGGDILIRQVVDSLLKTDFSLTSPRISDTVKSAAQRLSRRGLIAFEDGHYSPTVSGKKLLAKWQRTNYKIKIPKKWDKKWRLVVFDIPEKNKKERFAFSEKLKTLGFYPLQKSVFIYPYDCRNEIDFICNFMSIDRYVNYCIIEFLGKREGDLRYIFGLKFS